MLEPVVCHNWFYSIQQRELYHYKAGNVEAFSQKGDNKYYLHHFIKVLPKDARQVLVGKDTDGYWRVEDTLEWYFPPSQDRLYR